MDVLTSRAVLRENIYFLVLSTATLGKMLAAIRPETMGI
jgi:hypothetical protein